MRSYDRRQYLKTAGGAISGLALAGCTGDGDGGGGAGGDEGPDGTEDSGGTTTSRSKESIKIGFALTFSGPYAHAGNQLMEGFNLKLKEELGGTINGMEVETVKKDTQTKPSKAASIAKEMIQKEEVDFLVGPVASSSADAMLSVMNQHEGDLAWISPAAGSVDLTKACSKYFVRMSVTNWQLGAPYAQWLADNVGKSAYIFATDYSAGDQASKFFEEKFTEAGGEIVGTSRPSLGTSEWSSHMQKAKESGAELVYGFAPGTDETSMVKTYGNMGLKDAGIKLATMGTAATQSFMKSYGEAGIGALTWCVYSPNQKGEASLDFRRRYKDAYGHLPEYWGVYSYDAATMLAQGVTNGGVKPDDFISAVEGMEWESPPRGSMKIEADTHDLIYDFTVEEVVPLEENPEPLQHHGGSVTRKLVDTVPQVDSPDFGCDLTNQ